MSVCHPAAAFPGRMRKRMKKSSSTSSKGRLMSGSTDISGDLSRVTAWAFRRGTGIAHTFLNNSEGDVRLMVVGEASRERSRIDYPLHPKRNLELGERHWKDRPERKLGPHNGLPDKPS